MPTSINNQSDSVLYKNIVNPISRHLCFLNPNIITILNNLLVIPLVLNLSKNGKISYFIIIVFINRFLDLLDGSIARNCNKQTKLGAILDLLCDFLFITSGFIVFLYKFNKTSVSISLKIILNTFISLLILLVLYIILLEISSPSWLKKVNSKKTFINKSIIFYHDNSVILGVIISLTLKIILMWVKQKNK